MRRGGRGQTGGEERGAVGQPEAASLMLEGVRVGLGDQNDGP